MLTIPHPVTLEGDRVRLIPLEPTHLEALYEIAQDEEIWRYYPFNGADKKIFLQQYATILLEKQAGLRYPFVVIDKANGKMIGSTGFLHISKEHNNLEIGTTWYDRNYWSKGYNEECKLLLLQYCFETLYLNRVSLSTLDINKRSQKAITRIGAQFEGINRNKVIRSGIVRNVVVFSFIPEDWPQAKQTLNNLISERKLL